MRYRPTQKRGIRCDALIKLFVTVAAVFVLSACAVDSDAPNLQQQYQRAAIAITAAEKTLIAFRHDLHRYPELSGEEQRTSSKVAAQLQALGYDVRTQVGGYGVVGILEGAADGPIVAFRADMDATAASVPDPVTYASVIDGVRHICGHDIHTTIGIGLATGFAAIQDTLPGTIMLIFQPAEEAGTGADAMLADNLFAEYKPDVILATHTAPQELGQMATMSGGMMAGRTLVSVKLTGDGDLLDATGKVRSTLIGLGTVKGKERFRPTSSDFIAVDLVRQPEHSFDNLVVVQAYLMSAGLERRDSVKALVTQTLRALVISGVEMEISYEQALQGVNNDPAVLAVTSAGITSLVTDVEIQSLSVVYPVFSEDFGSFQLEVPGAMYFLGVSNAEKSTVGMPHSPDYVADDHAINIGARAMLAASLALMEKYESP